MAIKGRPASIHFLFRDGLKNFFIIVNSMLESYDSRTISVDDNGISGYYLKGFVLATMKALSENGTSVIYIMIDKISENELGVLIELYKKICRILCKFK